MFKKLPILPSGYLLDNLKTTIMSADFLRKYWNSFYLAVLFMAVSVLLSAFTAFAFGKYTLKGQRWLYGFILVRASSDSLPSSWR